MNEIKKSASEFIGYEYKEVIADSEYASMYIDCYYNFGWIPDENVPLVTTGHLTKIKLKRDRKIINKMELTRLQRHFEACAKEMSQLEKSKTSLASAWAIVVGVIGTAFMAGSTFAVVHEPPLITLCVILAIPGFLGWILPYFIYQTIKRRKTEKAIEMIEEKCDEIYEICEKGKQLI